MKRRLCNVVLLFLCCLTPLSACSSKGLTVSDSETTAADDGQSDEADESENAYEADCIYVYVTGAVENPGVYIMQTGDRIVDAVEAAGGFTEDAAETEVNLAQILEDEQQIHIPTQEEADAQAAAEEAAGLVNINTATLEELCTLTGIGEAKAQSIISYREENGDFSSIEEIMNISGIKEGVYEKIKDQITVG